VTAVSPQAEIDEIWVGDRDVTVTGRLIGVHDPSQRAALRARERDGEREVEAVATLEEGRFSTTIDLSAVTSGARPATRVWDLYLSVEGAGRLRLGRKLDDIARKKDVLVFPTLTVGEAATTERIQPYYTKKNNLSLRSKPGPAPRRDVPPKAPHKGRRGRRLRPHERALLRLAAHTRRLALRGLRAIAPDATPTAAGGDGHRRVYIVLMHAYGMGGTIRTVHNLAGYLARDHDVELISVFRRR
jgi:hypothetical protein